MLPNRLAGISRPFAALLVVIALLVLADAAIVTVRLASIHSGSSPPKVAQTGPQGTGHPCNHGFYVSQAAHAHKGGAYVSGIAKSKLGKSGACTAPLPASAPGHDSTGSDD